MSTNNQRTKVKRKVNSPLTLKERTIIEIRYRDGRNLTDIALEIGRNKGTVSREIRGKPRKGRGGYNAQRAHEQARERIEKRGNISKIEKNQKLKEYVLEKMKIGWSPEQIQIRLPIDHPKNKSMRVSYETIYRYVYSQIHRNGNGSIKPNGIDLRKCLPRRRKRRMKKGFRKAKKMERLLSLPSIEIRPNIVSKRKRVGDWEDDTMVSRQSLARIKSLNERKTGIVFFGKTKDAKARSCDTVVRNRLSNIPREYRKTLTRDRGCENREYLSLQKDLEMEIYFAHPYCSHERGSNENANGLFRRYFPKKTDFAKLSDEDISKVEHLINSRPRKRLKGLTPYEAFYKLTGVAIIP